MYSGTDPHLPRAATELDRRLGLRIRARRLELGMSQEKLADAIGVSFQQVQKYEKGSNRVAASTLFHITSALNMTPAELFDGLDGSKGDGAEQLGESDTFALVKAFASLKSPEKRRAALEAVKALSGQS